MRIYEAVFAYEMFAATDVETWILGRKSQLYNKLRHDLAHYFGGNNGVEEMSCYIMGVLRHTLYANPDIPYHISMVKP